MILDKIDGGELFDRIIEKENFSVNQKTNNNINCLVLLKKNIIFLLFFFDFIGRRRGQNHITTGGSVGLHALARLRSSRHQSRERVVRRH